MGEISDFEKKKKMLDTHELYGVSPEVFIGKPYEEVILLKIDLAHKVLDDAMPADDFRKWDNITMNRALAAIKHNTGLYEEMGFRYPGYQRNKDK